MLQCNNSIINVAMQCFPLHEMFSFSKIFDFRGLGLHKLFVGDKHIFVTRSYVLRKCAKKSVGWTIIFGVGRRGFLDKVKVP